MRAETLTGGRAGTAQPGRPGIPVTLTTVCRRTITKHIAIKFFNAEKLSKGFFGFGGKFIQDFRIDKYLICQYV